MYRPAAAPANLLHFPEALERLCAYSWPGNLREMQSVLKQAILRSHGPVLLPDVLPKFLEARGAPAAPVTPQGGRVDLVAFINQRLGPDSCDLHKATLRELDRLLLPRLLEYTDFNQKRTALPLGIARQTLRAKLRDLGLHLGHCVESDEDDTS